MLQYYLYYEDRRNAMALPNVRAADDLVTSSASISLGFLEQAQAKTDKARPHLQDALKLQKNLEDKGTVDEALRDEAIYAELAAASGFSKKATGHVSKRDIKRALQTSLRKMAGNDWRKELVYRFLLTRGDSLGGSMRNFAGYRAASKFATVLADELDKNGVRCEVQRASDNPDKVYAIAWEKRLIVFNKMFPHIKKNVDSVMLNTSMDASLSPAELLRQPDLILACGELKGGVDPAGADEHWKTANSALERIRRWRTPQWANVKLFFVGAAIETAMAHEIWDQLASGELDFAANLNVDAQMRDLVRWMAEI